MIQIVGQATGVTRLVFRSSIYRMRQGNTVVLGGTLSVEPDEDGSFSLFLSDNSTLQGYLGERWQWICEEWANGQVVRFAFSSDQGNLKYVDIRPLGVAL